MFLPLGKSYWSPIRQFFQVGVCNTLQVVQSTLNSDHDHIRSHCRHCSVGTLYQRGFWLLPAIANFSRGQRSRCDVVKWSLRIPIALLQALIRFADVPDAILVTKKIVKTVKPLCLPKYWRRQSQRINQRSARERWGDRFRYVVAGLTIVHTSSQFSRFKTDTPCPRQRVNKVT